MHRFLLKFDLCRKMCRQTPHDDQHRDSDRHGFQLPIRFHAGAPSSLIKSPADGIIRAGDGSTEPMPELERRLLADGGCRVTNATLHPVPHNYEYTVFINPQPQAGFFCIRHSTISRGNLATSVVRPLPPFAASYESRFMWTTGDRAGSNSTTPWSGLRSRGRRGVPSCVEGPLAVIPQGGFHGPLSRSMPRKPSGWRE